MIQEPTMPRLEFKGEVFGVRLVQRGPKDPHVCVQLIAEDDGHWDEMGETFSSFWIGDLIRQLQLAEQEMKYLPEDREGFGREFKSLHQEDVEGST